MDFIKTINSHFTQSISTPHLKSAEKCTSDRDWIDYIRSTEPTELDGKHAAYITPENLVALLENFAVSDDREAHFATLQALVRMQPFSRQEQVLNILDWRGKKNELCLFLRLVYPGHLPELVPHISLERLERWIENSWLINKSWPLQRDLESFEILIEAFQLRTARDIRFCFQEAREQGETSWISELNTIFNQPLLDKPEYKKVKDDIHRLIPPVTNLLKKVSPLDKTNPAELLKELPSLLKDPGMIDNIVLKELGFSQFNLNQMADLLDTSDEEVFNLFAEKAFKKPMVKLAWECLCIADQRNNAGMPQTLLLSAMLQIFRAEFSPDEFAQWMNDCKGKVNQAQIDNEPSFSNVSYELGVSFLRGAVTDLCLYQANPIQTGVVYAVSKTANLVFASAVPKIVKDLSERQMGRLNANFDVINSIAVMAFLSYSNTIGSWGLSMHLLSLFLKLFDFSFIDTVKRMVMR